MRGHGRSAIAARRFGVMVVVIGVFGALLPVASDTAPLDPSGDPDTTFNSTGQIINLPTQLGGTGGRLGFGALNQVRLNSQRILQIAAKFYY